MASRNWEGLSQDYRERLQRKGITRSQYESGISLAGARGHKATPERPERAEKHPERYEAYVFKRDELVSQIFDLKENLYGGSSKWNAERALRSINKTAKGRVRSIASLNRVLDVLERTHSLEAFAELEENDRDALYYH